MSPPSNSQNLFSGSPPGMPVLPGMPPGRPPLAHFVERFGHYVLQFALLTLWGTVALLTCAAGYVAIRLIVWAVQTVTTAIGV